MPCVHHIKLLHYSYLKKKKVKNFKYYSKYQALKISASDPKTELFQSMCTQHQLQRILPQQCAESVLWYMQWIHHQNVPMLHVIKYTQSSLAGKSILFSVNVHQFSYQSFHQIFLSYSTSPKKRKRWGKVVMKEKSSVNQINQNRGTLPFHMRSKTWTERCNKKC